MSGPVAVLEARVEPLLARCFEIKGLAPLAAFPAVTRDAALIVDERVRHTDIEKIIQKVAPKELERVELFDIFRTEGIGVGRKSMAYSFTYRSLTRTLTDEDANQYHAAVKEALKRELSAEIRES
jgi:phenylalanyl-tRNA synthetase beta chain